MMRRAAGLTLTELLIGSILFLVLGGALLVSFLTGQSSYLSSDAYIQVQEEARRAFDNVVRELRESVTISCGPPPAVQTGNCNGSRINFRVAMGYTGGVTQVGDGSTLNWYGHYIIDAAAQRLYRCATAGEGDAVDLAACRVLANHVDTAQSSFSWSTATRIVTCTVQVTYANPRLPSGSISTPRLVSQVRLRN